ncbi:hypothetical protein HDU77_005189 [Chytriomyces hyalinus]|nr:hypothetical protein HDU77_005189 [Chytriomyces hyalinus]
MPEPYNNPTDQASSNASAAFTASTASTAALAIVPPPSQEDTKVFPFCCRFHSVNNARKSQQSLRDAVCAFTYNRTTQPASLSVTAPETATAQISSLSSLTPRPASPQTTTYAFRFSSASSGWELTYQRMKNQIFEFYKTNDLIIS